MATKASTKKPDFEQSLKKLEAVVDRLEGGDLSLEKAVKEWEDGMKLRDTCEKILAQTQQKVDILLKKSGDQEPAEFDAD